MYARLYIASIVFLSRFTLPALSCPALIRLHYLVIPYYAACIDLHSYSLSTCFPAWRFLYWPAFLFYTTCITVLHYLHSHFTPPALACIPVLHCLHWLAFLFYTCIPVLHCLHWLVLLLFVSGFSQAVQSVLATVNRTNQSSPRIYYCLQCIVLCYSGIFK